MSEIYLLTTVTKRALGRRFLSCYEHNGLSAVLCTLAKGTATSEILDCLGLEMTEKAVMMTVITEETWKDVKRDMEDSLRIDVPGTGIAFLVPVSSIGGGLSPCPASAEGRCSGFFWTDRRMREKRRM